MSPHKESVEACESRADKLNVSRGSREQRKRKNIPEKNGLFVQNNGHFGAINTWYSGETLVWGSGHNFVVGGIDLASGSPVREGS